jgi:hypothetical protein
MHCGLMMADVADCGSSDCGLLFAGLWIGATRKSTLNPQSSIGNPQCLYQGNLL